MSPIDRTARWQRGVLLALLLTAFSLVGGYVALLFSALAGLSVGSCTGRDAENVRPDTTEEPAAGTVAGHVIRDQ
jgi:hypothetical protein